MNNETEPQFTSGEWTCESKFDKEYDQPVVQINTKGIEGICTVWSGADKMNKETLANAYLISAAPNMLTVAICQTIYEDYNNNPVADWARDYKSRFAKYGFTGGLKDLPAWLSDSRKAAIQKALNQQ